jgi:threonine/homoserine/homoserine lactone efflux protein
MAVPGDALTFALLALLIAATPGPNMVFLLSHAMDHGRRAGMVALLGVAIAFLLHVVLAASGLTGLLMATEHALQGLRLAGAGYLLWHSARVLAVAPALPSSVLRQRKTVRGHFASGFFVNALNPMVTVFFISVMPQFVSADEGRSVLGQSLGLGLQYTAVSLGVNLLVTLCAARVCAWMHGQPARLRALRCVTSAALAALALRLLCA